MVIVTWLTFFGALLSPTSALNKPIAGSDIVVVLHGSQAGNDARESIVGIHRGIQKSANTYLKAQMTSVEFLHLEMGQEGLFSDADAQVHVVPWLKRHFELLPAKIVISMGDAAASFVDSVANMVNSSLRPQWHIKCFQDLCDTDSIGNIAHESCMRFWPNGKVILKDIGYIYPSIRELVLLNDGSDIAEHIKDGLDAVSALERQALCGGCSISTVAINALNDLQTLFVLDGQFLLLPSMNGLPGVTAMQVGQSLQSKGAYAMVPMEVLPYGGFMAIRAHQGIGAEECSLQIAQTAYLADVTPYSTWDSDAYKMVVDKARVDSFPSIVFYEGMLHHNGRELWDPLEFVWRSQAISLAPKVLVFHSYSRGYGFTASEHSSYIDGLSLAGHQLRCTTAGLFCDGDLQVRVLYWLTKSYFTDTASKKLMAAYTMEYVKRYKPIVAYATDDNALQFGIIPCFEPLQKGPNPQYDDCSKTQYVVGGINKDVKRAYTSKCVEYNFNGSCARGNFFVEEGDAVAASCGACALGIEPECSGCHDLYEKPRPVNITIHYEAGDSKIVHMIVRGVKPNASKMLYIVDNTETSVGWKDAIVSQYASMVRDGTTQGISADFANDWRVVNTPQDFLNVVEAYQAKPEYILWMPSITAMLPLNSGEQNALWRTFIRANKLGEVSQVGTTNEALVQAASCPEGMGRLCATYTDMIVRGQAIAATLPIVNAPLTTTFANVDRAKQLESFGISRIPSFVLSIASGVYNMCPPGKFLQNDICTPCPSGTFKFDYGDSQEACVSCLSLNGIQMTSSEGSVLASQCMCKPTQYSDASCGYQSQLATSNVCCFQCSQGSYQDQPGQSSCIQCKGGKTTRFLGALTADTCVCPKGTLKSRDNETCSVCTEGFRCDEWSQTQLFALSGYYLSPTPVDGAKGAQPVLKCFGNPLRCPGGPPGSCATGREGLACALCEPMMDAESDGTCKPCRGKGVAPFTAAVLGTGFILVLVYFFSLKDNRAKQSLNLVFVTVTIGLVIQMLQVLGVLTTLQFSWGEPMNSLLKAMRVFNFDIELLSLGCVASPDPLPVFMMKCLSVLCGIGFVLFVHIVYVAFRHQCAFRSHNRELVSSIGFFYLAVYIAHTSMVVAALQCEKHPSGLLTVRQYPTVTCWKGGDHTSMVVVCFLFLTIPLAFLSLCTWVIQQFPQRVVHGDAPFLSMWSFLVFRFKPPQNWYLLITLLRSLIVSLVPTIPSSLIQIFCLQAFIVVAFLFLVRSSPWRSPDANYADGFLMLCIILMMNTAPFFVKDADLQFVGVISVSFVCLLLVLLPLAVLWKLVALIQSLGRKQFRFFLCHHKAGAGAFSRLLYLHLGEKLSLQRVFIDWENLTDLDRLFDSVRNTETLVVLCTKYISSRPWCMGELTTAHSTNNKTVLVKFPGFELPSTAFIESYNEVLQDGSGLLTYGITLELIQDALRWMCALPMLTLPDSLSSGVCIQVAEKLMIRSTNSETIAPGIESASLSLRVILVDRDDWEATASAFILARLLRKHILDVTKYVDVMPRGDITFSPYLEALLVVCTNDSWDNASFLANLIQGSAKVLKRLPIIAEDVFRIPDDTFFGKLKETCPKVRSSDGGLVPSQVIIQVVKTLFIEIGVAFCPQSPASTGALLDARANQIATRLQQISVGGFRTATLLHERKNARRASPAKNEVRPKVDDESDIQAIEMVVWEPGAI